jgi:phage terminase large subunit-like protein
MGIGDLTPTSIVLNDFAGNPSDTKGCVHVDFMIGSKTQLTTFFVIEGKGAYSLLLGRDWIHANCCIPSTMHQQLVQLVDNDVEVVQADDSVSVANVERAFWEYQGIYCFSGKDWGEGHVEPVNSDQQPIQAVGSYSNF